MSLAYYKNKKLLTILSSVFLISLFFLPILSHGALIVCDGVKVKCDFEEFVGTINRIITWIISIAGVIFAITLIYGGFLYMTSGDNPGNKTKATDMMWNTLKGFVIILTAWLIVYTILKTLAPNYPALFKFIGNN